MNSEIQRHITAIKASIALWGLTPEHPLDKSIELGTRDPDEIGPAIPFRVVQGIRHHSKDLTPTLRAAIKQVLVEVVYDEITEEQVNSLLRFILSDEEFGTFLQWSLRIEIGQDGTISTRVGPVTLFHDTEQWSVHGTSRHNRINEAMRNALLFAALTPPES
jgi:hypothetical protein